MNDYEFLTELGLCHRCRKQKVAPEKKFCFECLEKIREENARKYDPEYAKTYQKRRRQIYQEKKEKGICVRCSKPATHGLYCYEHSIQDKRRSQQRAEQRKRERHERGLVPEQRKKMGMCLWCGRPAIPGKECCEIHSEKFSEAGKKANNKNNPFAKEVNNGWKNRGIQRVSD